MIKYSFAIKDPLQVKKFFYEIDFEPPYEYMSLMFEGNESSSEVSEIVTGVEMVKQKKLETYTWGNQNGFEATARKALPGGDFFPDEGVLIYSILESEIPLYQIPFDEMIRILKEFIDFLKQHKR